MLFVVSKIGWALLSPLGLVLALFVVGVICILLSLPRAGISFVLAGVVIFTVLGLLPVGLDLMARLENQYPRPAIMGRISGIIVLGGTFESAPAATRGVLVINDRIERVLEGIRLARLHPEARLVFSGGE